MLVDICNKLAEDHSITIFTIYAKGEFEKELSNKVTLKSLYKYRYDEMSKLKRMLLPISIFFRKRGIYKKIKNNYDTEVAFLEGPITNIFGTKNPRTKKIAWIHNDISLVFGSGFKAKIKKLLNKNVYKKYSDLVFVSNDNLKKFEDTYDMDNKKHVVYNYINPASVIAKASLESVDYINSDIDGQVNFVSVCRIVEQKAIERLIDVHLKLISDGVKYKIYVVGDGPLKESMEDRIIQNNIADSFVLLGAKDNPYPYIKCADVFCLFSYYEGYPMVLEEAKILSKYIAITDTSAREVLRNYDNKFIVENSEDGIYKGIKEIVENKDKYLKNNKEYIYSNAGIMRQIQEILK